MTPIENVKKLLASGQNVFLAVEAAFADGKFGLDDALTLLQPLMAASEVVKNFEATKNEFMNADAEARAALVKYAQDTIKFKNAKSEAIVETVLGIVIYVGALIAIMKPAATPETPPVS